MTFYQQAIGLLLVLIILCGFIWALVTYTRSSRSTRCDKSVKHIPDPDPWSGKLGITGPSGVWGQCANDFMISHFALAKG